MAHLISPQALHQFRRQIDPRWRTSGKERFRFDLPRLIVGSLGTLGLVEEVILRTNPIPPRSQWVESHDADPFTVASRSSAFSGVVEWLINSGAPRRAHSRCCGVAELFNLDRRMVWLTDHSIFLNIAGLSTRRTQWVFGHICCVDWRWNRGETNPNLDLHFLQA